MKWILIITVCSSIDLQCLQPIQLSDTTYSSWRSCALAGYKATHNLISQFPAGVVNNKKLLGKFSCAEINEL
jgi:hypothetical protein